MKWLITGGAGFIGTNAAATLAAAGEKCVLADNFHRWAPSTTGPISATISA